MNIPPLRLVVDFPYSTSGTHFTVSYLLIHEGVQPTMNDRKESVLLYQRIPAPATKTSKKNKTTVRGLPLALTQRSLRDGVYHLDTDP